MIRSNNTLKSRKWATILKKAVGIAMAAAVIATTISMGTVEAKGKKNYAIRYCNTDGVEFWYHCNGYGDDEPITYLNRGAKLKHWIYVTTDDASQAYCQYVAWKRNGYIDVHYLN